MYYSKLRYRRMYTQHISNQTKIRPLAFESSGNFFDKKPINYIYDNITVFFVCTNPDKDAQSDEHCLSSLERQIIIPAYMQATELVGSQGAGLMMMETCRNVV